MTRSMHSSPDPLDKYVADVLGGKVVAGRLQRLACERHRLDLSHAPARGLDWRPEAAARAFAFFEGILRLAEGEHAGHPFILQPWQRFVIGSLFGWYGPDGYRRFRTAFAEIGKGNGKTPLAAGIGLYGLCADDEAAA
jgi:phage terminase large subunit-like protein